MVEAVLIEGLVFKGFIESSKDFNIIFENKNSTAFKVKPLKNNQPNKWSYLINFNTGTIRRVIAYMCGEKNKVHVNKFSYYCNKKNKILPSTAASYYSYPKSYDCYIKIYDHLTMYKKLIDSEKNYVPKSPDKMVETEYYKYGITSIDKLSTGSLGSGYSLL